MEVFKAKYFDGQTSKAHVVNVSFDERWLNFWSDETPEIHDVWNYTEIKVESLTSSNRLSLKFGDFPPQTLDFKDENAIAASSFVMPRKTVVAQSYQKVMKANPLKIVLFGLVAVIGVSLSYIYVISPFMANQIVKIIPPAVEINIGNSVINRLRPGIGSDHEAKSQKLQEFFDALDFAHEYPIEMHYIESDMVNAFAAPGGQIVVFEGLVERMESWEELAGLLAHELSHVEQRHSMKTLARSAASYGIISVLTGDVGGLSTIILENANQMNELSNSRDYEREADVVGLSLLRDAKINPSGMVDLFKRLNTEMEIDVGNALELFSTHPLTKDRINYLNEIISTDDSYQYQLGEHDDLERIFEEIKDLMLSVEVEDEGEEESVTEPIDYKASQEKEQ